MTQEINFVRNGSKIRNIATGEEVDHGSYNKAKAFMRKLAPGVGKNITKEMQKPISPWRAGKPKDYMSDKARAKAGLPPKKRAAALAKMGMTGLDADAYEGAEAI